ncbi:restriction endonuclease [Solitalea lacus]|uniref:restriction endonuclease n=1 Tax=Solitalea lacus TaxID=2911172 RepID=UPI001EDC59EA|nr:ATP cone domain-containing protein [Solitalea lacus]UKJ06725.1 restriction endonuclease [Solitalea lacus]
MKSSLLIEKASGEIVPFSAQKLGLSLKRAGASDAEINAIVDKVSSQLVNGSTTKEIYNIAFKLLKKQTNYTSAKYNLKQAIMQLGPSGFPFEKFLAELLKFQGFKTDLNVIIKGHCVNHEIDIIAEKDDKLFMIECKFHNQPGYICDVKIPLYIHSRFKDVEDQWERGLNYKTKFNRGWVVTNTKFSSDAIEYGKCAGLYLLGWDYPQNESLRELIDKEGLYPVTCLTTLAGAEKTKLLEQGVILCKEICVDPSLLTKIGISRGRLQKILNESRGICKHGSQYS